MTTPVYAASSRCECQASLTAELTEDRLALHGTAFLLGKRDIAPAHSIEAGDDVFDIAWLCPFCGRNVMRTFAASALRRIAKPAVRSGEQP